MTKSEKFEAFRVGLEKLTRETGVVIGGCGCCGSPSLFDLTVLLLNTTAFQTQ